MRHALPLFALFLAACSAEEKEPIGLAEEPSKWRATEFCRTTTCTVPKGWPNGDACQPPDWSADCAARGKKNVPLWWRSTCAGYSLNEKAGRKVSFAQASNAAREAFWAWTTRACPGGGRPSIDWRDLGPVSCARATYDGEGANQNVIVFHDDVWPHERKADELFGPIALTTVTFDKDTGEIRDADIEINTAEHDVIVPTGDALPSGAIDLQSVLTHEIGHFFGLAHSASTAAVMYESDDGTKKKRSLTQADIAGICAVYPPDGTRTVSKLVDESGAVASSGCAPAPRGGLSRSCP